MLSKYKYHIIIIAVIAVIGFILYRRYKNASDKKKAEQLQADLAKMSAGTATNNATAGNDSFPLKYDSRGENVKRLQVALNRIQKTGKITEDGVFKDETRLKIITTLATTQYGPGPTITEDQLNKIIKLGNEA